MAATRDRCTNASLGRGGSGHSLLLRWMPKRCLLLFQMEWETECPLAPLARGDSLQQLGTILKTEQATVAAVCLSSSGSFAACCVGIAAAAAAAAAAVVVVVAAAAVNPAHQIGPSATAAAIALRKVATPFAVGEVVAAAASTRLGWHEIAMQTTKALT